MRKYYLHSLVNKRTNQFFAECWRRELVQSSITSSIDQSDDPVEFLLSGEDARLKVRPWVGQNKCDAETRPRHATPRPLIHTHTHTFTHSRSPRALTGRGSIFRQRQPQESRLSLSLSPVSRIITVSYHCRHFYTQQHMITAITVNHAVYLLWWKQDLPIRDLS